MCRSSESLKMPFLKTSLESLAPIFGNAIELLASSSQARCGSLPAQSGREDGMFEVLCDENRRVDGDGCLLAASS
jgi:hypothetical protein